jgi:hypothetical protein
MYKALRNYHEDEDDMREYAFALALAEDNTKKKKIDPTVSFYLV